MPVPATRGEHRRVDVFDHCVKGLEFFLHGTFLSARQVPNTCSFTMKKGLGASRAGGEDRRSIFGGDLPRKRETAAG
jgi:hypothetical protein